MSSEVFGQPRVASLDAKFAADMEAIRRAERPGFVSSEANGCGEDGCVEQRPHTHTPCEVCSDWHPAYECLRPVVFDAVVGAWVDGHVAVTTAVLYALRHRGVSP